MHAHLRGQVRIGDENEIDNLLRERDKMLELIKEINARDLLNTLTDAGLIPNYAFAIAIGLACWIIPWVQTRSVRFRVTNYRIDYERGIFTRRIDTIELWHVDDISFKQGFLDRILGVGDITIMSDDKTTPRLNLDGVPNPRPLFDQLKQRIIAVKRQRGVIKMDMGT